jgi:hypothetical protein
MRLPLLTRTSQPEADSRPPPVPDISFKHGVMPSAEFCGDPGPCGPDGFADVQCWNDQGSYHKKVPCFAS